MTMADGYNGWMDAAKICILFIMTTAIGTGLVAGGLFAIVHFTSRRS